jgi:hypothetical protein
VLITFGADGPIHDLAASRTVTNGSIVAPMIHILTSVYCHFDRLLFTLEQLNSLGRLVSTDSTWPFIE